MVFTPELFKYVLTQMIPELIVHSQSQDEEQVRDHYDSMHPYPLNILTTILTNMPQEAMTFMDGQLCPSTHDTSSNT